MKFYVIHSPKALQKEDFGNFEVWCEWHSPDENEYIQSQLESEEQMQKLFWVPYEKGIDCEYPIIDLKNLPYREYLYIAAEINIPGLEPLAGYVSVVRNEVVTATIWTPDDEEIIFYRSDRVVAEDENVGAINYTKELFDIPAFRKIKYRSNYFLSNKVQVSGILEFSNK